MENNRDSVSLALGLSQEWEDSNREEISEIFSRFDLVSDAIENSIDTVRTGELGNTPVPVSDYEKKLVLTGMHIMSAYMKLKHKATLAQILGSMGSQFGETDID